MWLLSEENPAARAFDGLNARMAWSLTDMRAFLRGSPGAPRVPAAALGAVLVLAAGSLVFFVSGLLWELVRWLQTITPRKLVYGFMVLSTLVITVTALDILSGSRETRDEFIVDDT